MTDTTTAASTAAVASAWPAMSIAQAHAMLTAPGMPFEMEELDIRGVKTRVWKNAPPSLRDVLLLGRTHGEKVFLVYEDERVTYDAFFRAASAFAHELQAQGIKKGDRVAIIMRNLPEWPVVFHAIEALGGIATPLNAWWTGPELEYGLIDSGSKIAIMDAGSFKRITEHLPNCPELKRVYVSREPDEVSHPNVIKLESVLGAPPAYADLPDRELPDVEVTPEDDATAT